MDKRPANKKERRSALLKSATQQVARCRLFPDQYDRLLTWHPLWTCNGRLESFCTPLSPCGGEPWTSCLPKPSNPPLRLQQVQ